MLSLFNRKGRKKKSVHKRLSDFYDVLGHADDTYANLPLRIQLLIEKVSQGLPEYGPRKLRRSGPGMEFFEAREYMPGHDDPRKINARLSARTEKDMVIDKEAEIRQHFYLWRDSSPSMQFASEKAPFSKKEAAEIMLLAFAKTLAKNEEMIGILDKKGMYRGGKASDLLAEHLAEVTILTADMPFVERKLPRHSNVLLFSDFMVDPNEIREGLSHLQGIDLKGTLVIVLDPQEVDFNFEGTVEFEGLEGEGEIEFNKAESMKEQFQERLSAHIEEIRRIAKNRNFDVIVQRTDEPLEEALYTIYGLQADKPVKGLSHISPKP